MFILWLNINHRCNRAACSPTEEYLISQMTYEMLIYKWKGDDEDEGNSLWFQVWSCVYLTQSELSFAGCGVRWCKPEAQRVFQRPYVMNTVITQMRWRMCFCHPLLGTTFPGTSIHTLVHPYIGTSIQLFVCTLAQYNTHTTQLQDLPVNGGKAKLWVLKCLLPFKSEGIINAVIYWDVWQPDVHDFVYLFVSCIYILIPSCWLSWDSVFLIRRAVSRAALLAYQHSLIIFAITRKACRG